MATLLLIIHIVVAVVIIIVILMQSAKGEGLSGAFGMGQGTTTFFGADTANVLVKITTVLAIIFMCTSLALAYIQSRRGGSVADTTASAAEETTDEAATDEAATDEADEGAIGPAPDEGDEGEPAGEETAPETGETTDTEPPTADEAGTDEPDPDDEPETPNTDS